MLRRLRVRVDAGFPAHAGMDHQDLAANRPGARFPRPRGDGPTHLRTHARLQPVSPPTRGWTAWNEVLIAAYQGFPAHAGMDLRWSRRTIRAGRFPRPRGDGPQHGRRGRTRGRVSPPTRGWTCVGQRCRGLRYGFPAHAGMDLWTLVRRCFAGRFPRPRGDGPYRHRQIDVGPAVSPPTRGWTRLDLRVPRLHVGFPAHAGMDLVPSGQTNSEARFPRPRGDGPRVRRAADREAMVSPPTRGWTGDQPLQYFYLWGFPAHAGMDLSEREGGWQSYRFPRPRGDGPSPALHRRGRPPVSPPTRGWTWSII